MLNTYIPFPTNIHHRVNALCLMSKHVSGCRDKEERKKIMFWLKFANEQENIHVMLRDNSTIRFAIQCDDRFIEIKDMDEYMNIVNALKGTKYERDTLYIERLYVNRIS